jgi:hypothetical protein
MNIDLGGNTLVNGYFGGLLSGPDADVLLASDIGVTVQGWSSLLDSLVATLSGGTGTNWLMDNGSTSAVDSSVLAAAQQPVNVPSGLAALNSYGDLVVGNPNGMIPSPTSLPMLVYQDTAHGNVNGFSIVSNSNASDSSVVLKADLFYQYGGEHVGGIGAGNSGLWDVGNLSLMGEGGKLYIGALADDGTGNPVQIAGVTSFAGGLLIVNSDGSLTGNTGGRLQVNGDASAGEKGTGMFSVSSARR